MPNQDDPETVETSRARAYWRANLRIMGCLLVVWAFVSYGLGIVFSEALDTYRIGGFPLGFWFGQQGAIYVFVVLIFVYAIWMDRLDRRYGGDDSTIRARDGGDDVP